MRLSRWHRQHISQGLARHYRRVHRKEVARRRAISESLKRFYRRRGRRYRRRPGFPKSYRSPFRKYLKRPSGRMRERTFALVRVQAARPYKDAPSSVVWRPLALGYYSGKGARKISKDAIRERFELSDMHIRAHMKIVSIDGIYHIKAATTRKKIGGPWTQAQRRKGGRHAGKRGRKSWR
jgi:hypothetical protein